MLKTNSEAMVLLAQQKSTRDTTGIQDAVPLLPVIDQVHGVVVSSAQITDGAVLIRGQRVRQLSVTGLASDRVTAIIPFYRYLQTGRLSLSGEGFLIGATLADDMNLAIENPVTLRPR